jgi:hypothetical protein
MHCLISLLYYAEEVSRTDKSCTTKLQHGGNFVELIDSTATEQPN